MYRSKIVVLSPSLDVDGINKALLDYENLPTKLKEVLQNKKLQVDPKSREFLLYDQKTATTSKQIFYWGIHSIISKNGTPGWTEWLQGRLGWQLACDKEPFITIYRQLYDVKELAFRFFRERHETKSDIRRLYLDKLYYKFNAVTAVVGLENIPHQNVNKRSPPKEHLWNKVPAQASLQEAVSKIRPFLETLKFCCKDPSTKWTSIPWLNPIPPNQHQQRIANIDKAIHKLLRSSDFGPDAPVHWAHHPPCNSFAFSVVSAQAMEEVVAGMAFILSNLFLHKYWEWYPSVCGRMAYTKNVLELFVQHFQPKDPVDTLAHGLKTKVSIRS